MQKRETQLNSNYYQDRISFACIIFCCVIFLVHGILPLVPSNLTKFFKPIFMVACIFSAGAGFYRMKSIKWMLVLLAYFSVILFTNDITSSAINMYVSIMLFGAFVIIASCKIWTKREIRQIMLMFAISCAIQATIILWSNNGLIQSAGNQHISYLGKAVNRNPAAFAVAPGAICSLTILIYRNRRLSKTVTVFCLLSFLISAFAVFASGCRSAFYAMAAGCILCVLDRTKSVKADKRMLVRVGVVIFVLAIAVISKYALGDTYSSRLFDFSEEGFDSGRSEIWEQAWNGIKEKPIFGGGFDYWDEVGGEMVQSQAIEKFVQFQSWIRENL